MGSSLSKTPDITRDDIDDGVNLALAVAISQVPEPATAPVEEYLRLCQHCGLTTYLRQSICLNPGCKLSYLMLPAEEVGSRLQSWGPVSAGKRASAEQMEHERLKRFREWISSMKSGMHPKTNQPLDSVVTWGGKKWTWSSATGWREFASPELAAKAKEAIAKAMAKQAAVPMAAKTPLAAPPPRAVPLDQLYRKANAEQKAKAYAAMRSMLEQEEHRAEANAGLPTSSRAPALAKAPGFVITPVKAMPKVVPADLVVPQAAQMLASMMMQFMGMGPPMPPPPMHFGMGVPITIHPKAKASSSSSALPAPPALTVPGDTTDEEEGERPTRD